MAKDKKTVQFYTDWYQTFKALDNETAGQLIKHMLSFVNDENPTSENELINVLFIPFKLQFERDLAKWKKTVEKRSLAGKASAESKKNKLVKNQSVTDSTHVNTCQHMLTHVNKAQQSSTKSTVKDKEKDKDKEKVKVINKKKNIKKIEIPVLSDPEKNDLFKEWLDYKKDLGKPIKTTQGIKRIANKFEKNNNLLIRREMDRSMSNGWQDVFYDNNKKTGGNLAKDIVASKLKELLPEPPQPKDLDYDTPEGREYIRVFNHNQEVRRWNTKNVYKG